jgi:hypothetical protein
MEQRKKNPITKQLTKKETKETYWTPFGVTIGFEF